MKRNEILAVYHQGPEAVIQLVESLFMRIEKLEARVQQLKDQGEKTPKTATSRLPTNFISRSRKAPGKKPIENLANRLDSYIKS